jgi:hypothetical protein
MEADARPPDSDRFSALSEANYCTYIVTLPGTEVDDFPPMPACAPMIRDIIVSVIVLLWCRRDGL